MGGAGSPSSTHILTLGKFCSRVSWVLEQRTQPVCQVPRAAGPLRLLLNCCPIQEKERSYLAPGRVDGEKRERVPQTDRQGRCGMDDLEAQKVSDWLRVRKTLG